MQRRKFIQQSCFACAGMLVLGSTLSSCSALPMAIATHDSGKLSVEKSQFELNPVMLLRSNQTDADILLRKKDQRYTAIRMMCTHEEQPLTATADLLHCASHGSTFSLDGEVLREPALKPLKKLLITENDTHLIIHLNKYL